MEKKNTEYGRRNGDGIEIGTPLGWRVRANGTIVTMIAILACVVAVVVWVAHEKDRQSTDRDILLMKQMMTNYSDLTGNQRAILDEQRRTREAQDETNYILLNLAKPESQRERIDIAMPPSLRNRVIEHRSGSARR